MERSSRERESWEVVGRCWAGTGAGAGTGWAVFFSACLPALAWLSLVRVTRGSASRVCAATTGKGGGASDYLALGCWPARLAHHSCLLPDSISSLLAAPPLCLATDSDPDPNPNPNLNRIASQSQSQSQSRTKAVHYAWALQSKKIPRSHTLRLSDLQHAHGGPFSRPAKLKPPPSTPAGFQTFLLSGDWAHTASSLDYARVEWRQICQVSNPALAPLFCKVMF